MATFTIDQAGLPAGSADTSRTDGLDTGATVTLTVNSPAAASTFRFRLLWTPPEDTTAVASLTPTTPKVWTFSPTAGAYGTYRIELIVDEGLSTEERSVRLLGVRLPTGLLIPPLNTVADPTASLANAGGDVVAASEDNASDYAPAYLNAARYAGWWRALDQAIRAIGGGGGGGITEILGAFGISISNPMGPTATVDGTALLPRDGSRAMTGNLDFDGFIADKLGGANVFGVVDMNDETITRVSDVNFPSGTMKLQSFGIPYSGPAIVYTIPATDGGAGFLVSTDGAGQWGYTDPASLAGVPPTRTLTAGAGLTGGGDLTADRTFNVGANADGSIVVNADDVQVGVLATDGQHGNRGGGALHDVATIAVAGFMSASDKIKLDGLSNTTPAAPPDAIQFNGAGVFAGTSDFRWVDGSKSLLIEQQDSGLVSINKSAGWTYVGDGVGALVNWNNIGNVNWNADADPNRLFQINGFQGFNFSGIANGGTFGVSGIRAVTIGGDNAGEFFVENFNVFRWRDGLHVIEGASSNAGEALRLQPETAQGDQFIRFNDDGANEKGRFGCDGSLSPAQFYIEDPGNSAGVQFPNEPSGRGFLFSRTLNGNRSVLDWYGQFDLEQSPTVTRIQIGLTATGRDKRLDMIDGDGSTIGAALFLDESADTFTISGLNTNALRLQSAAGAVLSWPPADGTAGQALVTNGGGVLSFATISGGVSELIVNASVDPAPSAATLEANVITYACNVGSGGFTVTLPAGVAANTKVRIKDRFNGGLQADANTLTVAASGGETIDGQATQLITSALGSLTLIKGIGTDWHIV